jgi:hypothetical protein
MNKKTTTEHEHKQRYLVSAELLRLVGAIDGTERRNDVVGQLHASRAHLREARAGVNHNRGVGRDGIVPQLLVKHFPELV